ncbi:hypothetical protein GN958_ATG12084 [Phytophthora infestans]|uniref:Uncharacterized protein n=1 Tax=Phytophthora infestans TaxID=4787 RepID=A0A8S9UCA5_PHYIN|nr:hypothetical protein GN958_ATG20778 [Phytophthora infestans]KAF4138735.1 hypothetical protein GN958_ATG12084 [Phytophthora infestans]
MPSRTAAPVERGASTSRDLSCGYPT